MPTLEKKTIIWEGALAGLIGGAVFAAGQTLAAALAGLPPGAPWRFFASVAAGDEAVRRSLDFGTFILGAGVHFALSFLFGAFFGWIVSMINRPVRNNLTFELFGGMIYGLVLWLINVEIVGQFLYSWYLTALNPAVQALLHAVFFGLPMATWLALRIRDVEVPGVHAARHRYQTSTGDEEYLRLRQWELANREADHFTHTRRPPGPAEESTRRPGGPTLH